MSSKSTVISRKKVALNERIIWELKGNLPITKAAPEIATAAPRCGHRCYDDRENLPAELRKEGTPPHLVSYKRKKMMSRMGQRESGRQWKDDKIFYATADPRCLLTIDRSATISYLHTKYKTLC